MAQPKPKQKKIYLEWEVIQYTVDDMYVDLKEIKDQIDSVYGIPRGGLVAAAMFAYKLDLPVVQTIRPNTLIVDDIADTGYTLEQMDLHDTNITATLFLRYTTSFRPDYHGTFLDHDKWLVFPWEQ